MYCNEKEVANCLPVQKSSHHPCHPMLKGACLLRLKRTTHASKARCVSTIYQPVILRSNPPSQVRLRKGGAEAHRIVSTCQPRMRACCGAMGQSPCLFFLSLSGNYPRRIEPASIINPTQAHPCRSHAAPRKVEFRRAWRKNTDTLN